MTDIMRIAHFTNTYKPNINGVARSVSTFRDALSRLGHHVFVFAQEAPHKYEESEPYIFRYPGFKIPAFDYSVTLPRSRTVNNMLPALKLQVIHSNHPIALGVVAAKKAEKLKLPLVFTFHTRYVQYAEEYTAYIPWNQFVVDGVVVKPLASYLNRCHHIVTPSDSIRDSLVKYAGLTERVTTIPTGIDVAPFQQADGGQVRQKYGWTDEIVLVSVGRLAEEKNVKTLLDAVAQVMKQHDNTRLLLVGDGPQRGELEKYVKKLGLEKKMVFAGRVSFEQIANYLKAGDIFCFASVTETQGLVTMEAMAAGLPIVAVDATGTSDAVDDGVEGLLTADDSGALAQAISRAVNDPELRRKFSQNAVKKAASFDMMAQARKLVQVYEQAIEDQRAGRRIRIDEEMLKKMRREQA
ncbi:MAG: glycosyltransferase family 4 protein [Anaerolineae bacterium]